jgi:serine/threonine protein kinase
MKCNSSFGIDPERLDHLLAMGLEKSGSEEDMTGTASLDLFVEKCGTQIGRYKLLNVLGEGGMGIVYTAEQQQPIKRHVALKVIKPGMDSKRVIARFETEEQALALLDHPNIAHVYDAGTTQLGRPYFVMEHVKGVPVTEHCDRQKLTIEQRLGLFLQICEAIQHAHQKGIIHRDIKPSNILVSIHGERFVPKVIDFGVAKALGQPLTDRTLETQQGQIVGTPEYMSPEQVDMTNQDVDTRTDIYSLGVLLYKLITGKLPFEPKEIREGGINGLRHAICEESPKTPSTQVSGLNVEESTKLARLYQTDVGTLRRRLRGDLDWITLKALEKDRTRRYQTIQAFTEDIQRHLNDEPVLAGPPSKIYRLKKLLHKYRTQVIVAAVVVVMIALVAVISTMYTHAVSQNKEAGLIRHNDILSKARQLHTNGKSNEALTELESILNSKHIGLQARLLHAQLALALKGPAEAVGELEKLLGERDEIASQAHFLLARIYLESDPGDPKTTKQYQEKAKEHQQKGENLFPETAEAYFNRAMFTGNVKKTLEYLNKSVELDRSYYDALKSRAQAFYTLRNYRRMERDAVAMTALREWDPLGYSLIAIALRETDDATDALEYHDKAIRLSPDDPELYRQRY